MSLPCPPDRLLDAAPRCKLNDIAEEIKSTAFRVTRVGELIGREVAARLGVPFGIVDLSLAPAPKSATAWAKSCT